jgi:hypothetical protein
MFPTRLFKQGVRIEISERFSLQPSIFRQRVHQKAYAFDFKVKVVAKIFLVSPTIDIDRSNFAPDDAEKIA